MKTLEHKKLKGMLPFGSFAKIARINNVTTQWVTQVAKHPDKDLILYDKIIDYAIQMNNDKQRTKQLISDKVKLLLNE
jgi:hypothetical protein